MNMHGLDKMVVTVSKEKVLEQQVVEGRFS